MQTREFIKPPSRKERFVLRLMIFIGIGCMAFFLYGLLQPQHIGYAPFYWTLMVGVAYLCLKILHEWYHYYSISIPDTPTLSKDYSVDIFTTFCVGEPHAMVIETLEAIQKITYPHTTYLCDETNDAYLKQVCRASGIYHLTRENRKDAKAGNINNALKHSAGELCVVLDPDHVPDPDFLDPIIPHFKDPKVGFVQVVQAYKNLHDGLIAKGAAQQTFQFYGPMMMSMHTYGTVQAIGANCTFRRTALNSIGGHAAGLSEDMHTAMQLHAKGWKSVYVPAILSRGLVPSTLSAYYKQQLKWSRGTFELLLTTYPKLFKHFTWRQQLHYGTLPFHFFCGVIFFINFLIPVLSLMMGVIPFSIDLVTFSLLGVPLLASTILIRHYVQRWVMEEDERGFHVVGGLLLIGTWWIYIMGLVYTLIRKKVPYIPTPKDNQTTNPWKLNLPNIIIGLLSLGAIVYGLAYDWNPYTFIMGGIAALNCVFMGFVIIASYQNVLGFFASQFRVFRSIGSYLKIMKRKFWLLRHSLYSGARSLALPIMLITIAISGFFLIRETSIHPTPSRQASMRSNGLYTGIFFPAMADGLTAIPQVMNYHQQYNTQFNIVSLYIPWGDETRCNFPKHLIDSIYQLGATPMITWEPWTSLFDSAQHYTPLLHEQKVFHFISQGLFDHYLKAYALEIKALNRPLYLRFAHEFDNPAYPWSGRGNNSPEEFIHAWRYIHDFFTREEVYNIIWVWNPWKPEAVDHYFPGEAYVDWIGVDILNYGRLNTDNNWYSFEELYLPFHEHPLFQSGVPVMVAEMGSLKTEEKQFLWWTDAFRAIYSQFDEIKALVFFNSDQDVNVPEKAEKDTLDWKLQHPLSVFTALNNTLNQDTTTLGHLPEISVSPMTTPHSPVNFDTLRGINFTKGQHWFKNFHTLTTRELNRDFRQLKDLGVNTIKRYGPTVYYKNLLSVARAHDIKVHYGFWVPESLDFMTDTQQLSELTEEVTATIHTLKNEEIITSWNIGNGMLQHLQKQYAKPDLLYQQTAYLLWLKNLIGKIKEIDPRRPLTLDVEVSKHLEKDMEFLHTYLPEIDAFGLIVYEDNEGTEQIDKLEAPYFFSRISADQYLQLPDSKAGSFITEWQDTKTKTSVTFDGLVDHWGRQKPPYHKLAAQWGHEPGPTKLPALQILRPAFPTLPGTTLTYQALILKGDEWVLVDSLYNDMLLTWHLVKNNDAGQGIFMQDLGEGVSVSLEIPEDPSTYILYLTGAKEEDVVSDQSILNTPLF